MSASHAWVADAIRGQGKIIYGVNTGFGSLANRQISADEARQLSRNLILLCVCGVGDPLPGEIVARHDDDPRQHAGQGPFGRAARRGADADRHAQRRCHTLACRPKARSAPAATWPRWRTSPPC